MGKRCRVCRVGRVGDRALARGTKKGVRTRTIRSTFSSYSSGHAASIVGRSDDIEQWHSTTDRPWSQYFCCAVAGNREFVRSHPVATKRALRAMLKAADLCGVDPERAAKLLVDNGVTAPYEFVVQTLKEVPYGKWRDYDPEDTMRFYALRLHEAGMIKSGPQKILAQGTR